MRAAHAFDDFHPQWRAPPAPAGCFPVNREKTVQIARQRAPCSARSVGGSPLHLDAVLGAPFAQRFFLRLGLVFVPAFEGADPDEKILESPIGALAGKDGGDLVVGFPAARPRSS